MFHGLDDSFQKLDNPEGEPLRPRFVGRYRRLIYGFALASAVLEGEPDRIGPPPPPREKRTPGGVVLPTAVARGPG